MIIDLFQWNISYTEFYTWASDNNADILYINPPEGATLSALFEIKKEEDFIAFKLRFLKEFKYHKLGYTGPFADDMGSYTI